MDKYEQLTQDLIEAKNLAVEGDKIVDDGGSANLDSTFLRLPRWNESKVLEAIRNADMFCGKKMKWIGQGYLLSVNTGMGYKRTVARNIFLKCLREKGYDVLSFDRMD